MTFFQFVLGDIFDKDVPVLYSLEIPQFLRDIPVCNSSCQLKQREALVNLFSNTNGPKWLKGKKWNTTAFLCDWEGVLCYNRTLHVLAIDLQGNTGMQGYVGNALSELPFLLGVSMGRTGIKGSVSRLLHSFKEFFLRFDFAYNKLYGSFPSDISKTWKKMGKIQLSGNTQVKGKLSDDICRLYDLQVLSLGETGITGSIPRCISKLSKLFFLDLETLSLTGKLKYLKGLSNLRWIHLMSNNIDGPIPEDLGNWFPGVIQLVLQGNNLKGNVPASIGNLKYLSLLQLSGNKGLIGPLPVSFSNLTSLTMLDISDTSISGFEAGLKLKSPSLRSFVAKGNKHFSESIYKLIEVLEASKESLIQLDVRGCNIYGKFDKYNDDTNIVNGIFQFSRLVFLDLSGNRGLFGTIPDPIGSVSLLIFFNASCTGLSSVLPYYYLVKLKVLQEIDVRGNPNMNGEMDKQYINIDYSVMKKENSTNKFVCPAFSFRHNNGMILVDSSYYDRKYCQCIEGYYGIGGYCRKCMKGGSCNFWSKSRALNNTSYDGHLLSNMTVQKGFWPYPHQNDVQQFLPCHWTLPGKENCNPLGSVKCFLKRSNNKFTTMCEGEICRRGSTGRLCSECERGFYKSKAQCHRCSEPQKELKLVFVILVVIFMLVAGIGLCSRRYKAVAVLLAIAQAIVVLVLAVLGFIPSWLAQINIILFLISVAGFGKSCKVLVKIIVFYVQIVDSLITSAHIWPVSVYDFAGFLSSAVNLRFAVLKCQQPNLFNPLGQIILLMILPLLVVALLTIFSLVISCFFHHRWPNMKYKCGNLCIMFLNLSYFPLVKATASVLLPCRSVRGKSFMASFPWVDCPSQQYYLIRSLAYCSLVFYVIGTPLFFLGLLYWKRNDIAEGNQTTKDWLGSLYMPYKVKYRSFMEFLLIMRRTALAFFSAFLLDDISLQLGLITAVFLISLTYESQARPFFPTHHVASCDKKPNTCTCLGLENLLELTMLITLLVSFIAVKSSVLEKQVSSSLIWVISIGNAVLGLVLASCFVFLLFRREPGSEDHREEDRSPLVQEPQTFDTSYHTIQPQS